MKATNEDFYNEILYCHKHNDGNGDIVPFNEIEFGKYEPPTCSLHPNSIYRIISITDKHLLKDNKILSHKKNIIKINIQSYSARNELILIFANLGIKIWVEKEPKIKINGMNSFVCFEIQDNQIGGKE